MRINQSKRWTGDVFFPQAEPVRNTFHQDRLAGAQRAVEKNELATGKRCTDTDAQVESLAFGCRNEFPGDN